MKRLLIAVGSVLVLLAVVVSLAMWKSNGNLIDFIAGQYGPEPIIGDAGSGKLMISCNRANIGNNDYLSKSLTN